MSKFLIILNLLILCSCANQSFVQKSEGIKVAKKAFKKSIDLNIAMSCFQDDGKKIINYYGDFSKQERDFIRQSIFPIRQTSSLSNAFMVSGNNDSVTITSTRWTNYQVTTKSCILSNSKGESIRITTEKLQVVAFF